MSAENYTVVMIPIAEITANPEFNIRKNMGDISELAESIKEFGIQQPLKVFPSKKGYSLIYGFRRLAAATEAGLTEVPAMVMPKNSKEVDRLKENYLENVARQQLSSIEEARGAKAIIDAGASREEICRTLGWTPTKLTQRLNLLDLSSVLQQALDSGRIIVQHARMIAMLPDDQHEKYVEIAASLQDGTKLREMVERELKIVEAPEEESDPLAEPSLSELNAEAEGSDDVGHDVRENIRQMFLQLVDKYVDNGVTREKALERLGVIAWDALDDGSCRHLENVMFDLLVCMGLIDDADFIEPDVKDEGDDAPDFE
jgi:ParB/RepB/Spo0J family partition protein